MGLSTNGNESLLDLLHDAEFFLTITNKFLETMQQYGLNISLRVGHAEYTATDILFDNETETYTHISQEAIDKFISWQITTKAKTKYIYDFAILYTGLLMGDSNGIALVGSICEEGLAASIVVHYGGMATSFITAHEVGHVLGSNHDGWVSHNVMRKDVVFAYDSPKRFSFSECSINFILQFLETINDSCLLETHSAAHLPRVTIDKYNGRLRDGHTACRRAYGINSSVCNIERDDPNHPIAEKHRECLVFYCHSGSPNDQECFALHATESMPCNKDMICHFGKCVTDHYGIAKNTLPNCMFGDLEEIDLDNQKWTCGALYNHFGGRLCTNLAPRECCVTCEEKKVANVSDCYGDYKNFKINEVDYKNCKNAIRANNIPTVCKNGTDFAEACCETCFNKTSILDGCLGGDQKKIKVTYMGISKTTTCPYAYKEFGGALCTEIDRKGCCATCESHKEADKCYGDYTTVYFGKNKKRQTNCTAAIHKYGELEICQSTSIYLKSCCSTCNKRKGQGDCLYEPKYSTTTSASGHLFRYISHDCSQLLDFQCNLPGVKETCCKGCDPSSPRG